MGRYVPNNLKLWLLLRYSSIMDSGQYEHGLLCYSFVCSLCKEAERMPAPAVNLPILTHSLVLSPQSVISC